MLTGAIRQLSSKDIAELDQQHEPLLKNSSDLEKVTELLQGLHIKIKKTKENNDDQKEQQRQEQAKRGVQKAQQVWGNRTSSMGSMGSMDSKHEPLIIPQGSFKKRLTQEMCNPHVALSWMQQ